MNSLQTKLKSTRVQKLLESFPSRQLLDIHENHTLEEALRILNEEKIQALPVYRFVDQKKSYVGIVSIMDILAKTAFFRMFQFDESKEPKPLTIEEFEQVIKRDEAYFKTAVSELLGLTSESIKSWVIQSSESHLSAIVLAFTRGGFHRLLVVSEGDGSVRMITQSDLVKWMVNELKEELEKEYASVRASDVNELITVQMTKAATRIKLNRVAVHVIKCRYDMTAFACFRVLFLNRVSAVPIVKEDGVAIDQLSASDLRAIVGGNVSGVEDLKLEVGEYLGVIRGDSKHELAVCNEDTGYFDVLKYLVAGRLHHLWILRDGKPVGNISLSDVLALVAPVDDKALGEILEE